MRALLIAALLLAGCTMNGYRDESGKIILGPNAMGDDPIHHKAYPSYAEYAVATHELDEMKADGYSEGQQLCFARTLVENLPGNLPDRLNDYASNKTILMEASSRRCRKT
jgi:hypothetical protein